MPSERAEGRTVSAGPCSQIWRAPMRAMARDVNCWGEQGQGAQESGFRGSTGDEE